MWTWLGSLIAGPLVEAYRAKLAAGNTKDALAAELAKRELDVQAAEIEAQKQIRILQIGHWYEPEKIIGYCVAFIIAKVLVWDICLGLGSTPEPKGWIADISNLVVMFYFGKRGIENAVRIWKAK